MSTEAIEERLAGVPVYALSNSSEEFVLVSGFKTGKNLGLFCFSEADAAALLEQMKSMDPSMRNGSQVVAVALNKVSSIFRCNKFSILLFRFICYLYYCFLKRKAYIPYTGRSIPVLRLVKIGFVFKGWF